MIALANHLWQSTLFALAAGAITILLRRNSASARYAVWLAASVKFLIPFSLLAGLGARSAWLLGPTIAPQFTSAIGQISHPFVRPITPFAVSAMTSVTTTPASMIPNVLIAVWICGGIAVCLGRISRLRQVRRTLKESSVALQTGRESELLRRVLESGGMPPLRLVASRSAMEPGVCGVIRPFLLLPFDISAHLGEAELEAIFAHELAHVRRRDNLTAGIHAIAETVFWFHPFVWWIGAHLLQERERACDQETLSMGCEPQVYAEGILKVCRYYVTAPVIFVAGVTGSNLKMRIEEIMKNQTTFPLRFGKRLFLAMAAAAAIGGPILAGLMTAPMVRAQAPVRVIAAVESAARFTVIAETPQGQRGAPPASAVRQTPGQVTPAPVPPDWLGEVSLLITDPERIAFQQLKDDERQRFIENFWGQRNPTPGTPTNEFKDKFYERFAYANAHFSTSIPGAQTDRGKMYILNGPPDELISHPSGGTYYRITPEGRGATMTFPFEAWRYRHIDGKGDNIIYEFVDKEMNGNYTLEYDPGAKAKDDNSDGKRNVQGQLRFTF